MVCNITHSLSGKYKKGRISPAYLRQLLEEPTNQL